MHPLLKLAQLVPIQPPAPALISEAGIAEAVRNHPFARVQRRFDDLLDMLQARRKHQQRLGADAHRLVQQYLAQLFAKRRAARFARDQHVGPRCRNASANHARWVLLPAPSMPSKVMNFALLIICMFLAFSNECVLC